VLVDYGFRDIIEGHFDAGIRLGEKLEQDMIALKVGPELRMVTVASPAYIARHGQPEHPEQLIGHRCINYRMIASGAIYAWEFEQENRPLEVRVPGPLIFNEPEIMLDCALDGLGIAYLLEDDVLSHLAAGRLVRLLETWEVPFPGFHLYYSSRRQVRPVLAAFLTMLREQRVAG
jgi:DNA-binding transcriptional LysR family regulator